MSHNKIKEHHCQYLELERHHLKEEKSVFLKILEKADNFDS